MCMRPKSPAPAPVIVPEQELPEVKAPATKKSKDNESLEKKRKGSSSLRIRRARNDVGGASGGSGLSIPK